MTGLELGVGLSGVGVLVTTGVGVGGKVIGVGVGGKIIGVGVGGKVTAVGVGGKAKGVGVSDTVAQLTPARVNADTA